MPTLNLQDEDWWPQGVLRTFADNRALLAHRRGMDDVIRTTPFREAAAELEAFIQPHSVVAYHCTKEPSAGFYREHGLQLLDLRAHQEHFLTTYGTIFTTAEIDIIRQAWANYFIPSQTRYRDRRLWLTFSIRAIVIGDAEPLFRYFGGEAISMPLGEHPTIGPKLASLGTGVVVVVRFPAQQFRHTGCVENPLAYTAFCAAHRRINPQALCSGSEGWLEQGIIPAQVIDVVPADDFCRQHQSLA